MKMSVHSTSAVVPLPQEVPFASSKFATIPLKVLLSMPPPSFRNEQLTSMYDRLTQHGEAFENASLDAAAYVCRRVGREDVRLQQTVKDIVNCSYNAHYLHDQLTFEDIATDSHKKTEVFMITQQIEGILLPLVTVRVLVDKELDCFEIFSKESVLKRAAEFSRFAYHPLLDVPASVLDEQTRKRLDFHKRHLFRILLRGAFRFLKSRKFQTSYLIMPPHVKRYMDGCGFRLTDMPESHLLPSDSHDVVRRAFYKYWRPESPIHEQPAVYNLDFRIKPLMKIVMGQRIYL